MIIIPALIISFVPCIALYLWLRKLHGSDTDYVKVERVDPVTGKAVSSKKKRKKSSKKAKKRGKICPLSST